MRPLGVVMTQPRPERLAASPRAGVGHRVRPLPQQRLDEAFGFAVGLWSVRARARQSNPGAGGTPLKAMTAIRAAVVGEHALHDDPPSSKPLERPTQKAAGGGARLIGKHFDIGGATVIIDGHVDVLPAGAYAAAPHGMDAMPDPKNAPERLDIEMHELTGPCPLIARDGCRRLEGGESIEPEPRQDRSHRGSADL